MEVERLMTRGVRTCGPNDTLDRAAQIMWDNDCGCVPIVDGGGKLIAMLTDRDVCMSAFTQGRPLHEIPVSRAASRNVVTVRERDSVEAAERLMQQHQIRRVPVVDANGILKGVLSMNDLARSALSTGGISAQEVARTLAAVSQPRPSAAPPHPAQAHAVGQAAHAP